MMMMLSMPELSASSTPYWISGLSTSGSISFGCALVAGKKRVPRPAAGKAALRTFIVLRRQLKVEIRSDLRVHIVVSRRAQVQPFRPAKSFRRGERGGIRLLPARILPQAPILLQVQLT